MTSVAKPFLGGVPFLGQALGVGQHERSRTAVEGRFQTCEGVDFVGAWVRARQH
ncbi:MAG: hypothetical protein ACHP85_19290 [Burkholderiales bacterium]